MNNCCKYCEMDFYIGGGCFGCLNYELENEISNEQAINILNREFGNSDNEVFPEVSIALDMAIKALKKESEIEDIKKEIKDLDYLVNDAKYSDAETRIHNADYLMYEIYKILDRHINADVESEEQA